MGEDACLVSRFGCFNKYTRGKTPESRCQVYYNRKLRLFWWKQEKRTLNNRRSTQYNRYFFSNKTGLYSRSFVDVVGSIICDGLLCRFIGLTVVNLILEIDLFCSHGEAMMVLSCVAVSFNHRYVGNWYWFSRGCRGRVWQEIKNDLHLPIVFQCCFKHQLLVESNLSSPVDSANRGDVWNNIENNGQLYVS